jgi:hypothetical protein
MTNRFRYALDPLCVLACAGYAIDRFILKPNIAWWFVHGQLSDLLLIPCALPLVLWIQRRLRLRMHDNAPGASEIVLHLMVWSIAAELLAPLFLAVTADPRDVVAYATGAVFSWGWWNLPARWETARESASNE